MKHKDFINRLNLTGIILLIGIPLVFVNECHGQAKVDYVKKYAGEYLIKIEGVRTDDIERLILKPNKECIWKWETGRYPDIKYGTWTADRGKIKTLIKGKSGQIPETFNWREGKFRSEDGYDRHIVKVKGL